jgi:hypothetical protein
MLARKKETHYLTYLLISLPWYGLSTRMSDIPRILTANYTTTQLLQEPVQ